jgi:hypothetical protein
MPSLYLGLLEQESHWSRSLLAMEQKGAGAMVTKKKKPGTSGSRRSWTLQI